MSDADAVLANPASDTAPDEHAGSVFRDLPAGGGDLRAGEAAAASNDDGDRRYPLRVRLGTIVGSVVALWAAIWFGGQALLHALGLE